MALKRTLPVVVIVAKLDVCVWFSATTFIINSRYASTKVQIISAQGKGAQGMSLRINTVCTF